MLAGMDGELQAMAAASSECSSGCQSGWTTYLDDDRSSQSCGTARFHGKAAQQPYYYGDYSEEEEDLSMISDASSGPRHPQCSAGNDVVVEAVGAAAHAISSAAERRGRRVDAASARRQSNKAAAAASLLEDTASSPAFLGYTKATSSGEVNGYGYADEPMMEFGNAADFSCAFSATTGFKSPLNGTPLDGYLQMQFSPAPAKPMPTRQVCRDGGEKKRW
ncbi:hypothetical protein EJB05_07675, partial [Eragrostis curvula]